MYGRPLPARRLAAAYTQIQKYPEAIDDCEKSIYIDPNYSKAYSRLGLAHYAQGNYNDAISQGFLKEPQIYEQLLSSITAHVVACVAACLSVVYGIVYFSFFFVVSLLHTASSSVVIVVMETLLPSPEFSSSTMVLLPLVFCCPPSPVLHNVSVSGLLLPIV
ncbi:Small glutamine-rich tetratricopeptide repeat-containing protein beta [Nymphaea thermarum]|nr:Small glutamine-rich tetratricopeptide repeat-containing protein beta [Nymphaea thermarum]